MAPRKPVTAQLEVTVFSKYDRFVDLVENVEIGKDPMTVKLHPWLQANIDSGLLIVVTPE